MAHFQNKLVAVLNPSVPPGKLMNALAHMCIGFGNSLNRDALRLTNYKDASGNDHLHISEIPFIILEGNNNKIRNLRQQAKLEGIAFADFTHTMAIGTYQEQIELSAQTKEEDLIYSGIVLFGDCEKVSALTKKFSLWK